MDFDSLQKLMKDSGIVGCGGAGFPSYAKLNKNVDTLIINCAECEPLLRLHRQLMERKTKVILQTIEFLAETLGVKNVYIGIKAAYVDAVNSIKANIDSFPLIKIHLLDEIYPAGDEIVLIYEVTKRIVKPGCLPASVGALVFNVETIYNLYRALNGKNVTHKYVTVTGEVKNPKTFYAPIGSELYGLIKRCGGVTIDDPVILIGGPMMGQLTHDMDVVTKTTNAIIVLSKDHPVVKRKQVKISSDIKRAMAACSQCHYCTDMCPRHLIGHPIDPAEFMRVVSNHDTHNVTPYLNAKYCCGCGVCETYACHQGLSPRALLTAFKNRMRINGIVTPDFIGEVIPDKDRELKRVPLPRLRSRLSLNKYNVSAPIYLDPINAKEVIIKLNQHIGAPAIPIVKVNQIVKEGDIIAQANPKSMSVNIHASIDGVIYEVTDSHITIRKVID